MKDFTLKDLKEATIRWAWTLWISTKMTAVFGVGAVLYLVLLCDMKLQEIGIDWIGVCVMIVWGALVSMVTLKEYNKLANE